MARMTRPTSARASSVIGSSGSSAPVMRWAIAAVAGPMFSVRISAGPENVADG